MAIARIYTLCARYIKPHDVITPTEAAACPEACQREIYFPLGDSAMRDISIFRHVIARRARHALRDKYETFEKLCRPDHCQRMDHAGDNAPWLLNACIIC